MPVELVKIEESVGGDGEQGIVESPQLLGERRELLRARTALVMTARQYYDDLAAKTRAEGSKEEHIEDVHKAQGQTALATARLEVMVQDALRADAEYLKLRVEAAKSALKRDIARNDDQAKKAVNPNDPRNTPGGRGNPRRPHGAGERGGSMAQGKTPASAAKDSPEDPRS